MSFYTKDDHTFVICAYGESSFLDECLESIRNQKILGNVIISTSTPNSVIQNLAKKYGYPLVQSNQKPGISSDWNFALSQVRTPLATIAHQDDTYSPTYLESMLEFFNRASQPLIGFADYGELHGTRTVNSNLNLIIKRILLHPLIKQRNWSKVNLRRRILSFGSSICCPSVTYNLDFLSQPIFKSNFKCDLDWQTWEELSKLSGDFVYCNKILMYHRIHQESETTRAIENNTRTKEDIEMFSKFWPNPIVQVISRLYKVSTLSNH